MRKMLVRAGIGAVALVTMAGCGQTLTIGGQPASSTPASNADIQLVGGPAPAQPTTTTPSSIPLGSLSAPKVVQLTAKDSPLGKIVVDQDGRTLYRFDKDSPKPPTTTCTGGCQTTWPPEVIQPGGKVYADGVDKSVVGTVTRPDGTTQLTIGGWARAYASSPCGWVCGNQRVQPQTGSVCRTGALLRIMIRRSTGLCRTAASATSHLAWPMSPTRPTTPAGRSGHWAARPGRRRSSTWTRTAPSPTERR